MTTPGDARSTILSRIDLALGPSPSKADAAAEWEKLSRDYIRSGSLVGTGLIELFVHRLTDYGAQIFHASEEQIRPTIEKILNNRD